MAQFYLHIRNSYGEADDDEGVEAASLAEAREKAITGIRALLSAEVKNGEMNLNGRIDIADDSGALLLTVPFADAVTIEG
jgi:hypothetical protein